MVEAAQFNDASTGLFFMRVRFETRSTWTASVAKGLKESFSRLAEPLGMRWIVRAPAFTTQFLAVGAIVKSGAPRSCESHR